MTETDGQLTGKFGTINASYSRFFNIDNGISTLLKLERLGAGPWKLNIRSILSWAISYLVPIGKTPALLFTMDKKNIYANSYEVAFLFSVIEGLIRLLAIISTFFFWLWIVVLVYWFLRLKFFYWHDIYSYLQVLGLIGLSPVLLTVVSWRIIEKGYSYYLTSYANKHTEIEKENI